jgi:hypothetical protein
MSRVLIGEEMEFEYNKCMSIARRGEGISMDGRRYHVKNTSL